MEALADREDAHHDGEEDRRRRPVEAPPTIETTTQQPAQRTPSAAIIRIRLRPSESFAIGSCASTITTVFTKKIDPDRRLGHARLVLREHGKELEAGHAGEDEQRVERDERP